MGFPSVGIRIALLQALTQVQEVTLTFVPKILAILIVMSFAAPFCRRRHLHVRRADLRQNSKRVLEGLYRLFLGASVPRNVPLRHLRTSLTGHSWTQVFTTSYDSRFGPLPVLPIRAAPNRRRDDQERLGCEVQGTMSDLHSRGLMATHSPQ